MKKTIFIDNRRPDNTDYPKFSPSDLHKEPLLVDMGQYIVNRDGDIMITTTSNKKYYPVESFIDEINVGFFRAKYLKNKDDLLEYAQQCRLATPAEIKQANKWKPDTLKSDQTGQLMLV